MTLLAIGPVLIIGVNVISVVPRFAHFKNQIESFVVNSFVSGTQVHVLYYLNLIEKQSHLLSWWNILFLLMTIFLSLISLERHINDIWGVELTPGRVKRILIYWTMVVSGPILLSLGIVLNAYVNSFSFFGVNLDISHHLGVLSFLFILLGFTILYYVVPHTRVKIRHACLGGVVAAILFILSKSLFQYYVIYFSVYQRLYGALATIPLFLIWVYIAWMIFFIGAEVVNGLRLGRARRSLHKLPLFYVCFDLVGLLYQGENNHGLSFQQIIDQEGLYPLSTIGLALRRLQSAQLVVQDKDLYVLSSCIGEVSFYEFCHRIGCFIPQGARPGGVSGRWDEQLMASLNQWHNCLSKNLSKPVVECYRSDATTQNN